jgi:hypothetical protein
MDLHGWRCSNNTPLGIFFCPGIVKDSKGNSICTPHFYVDNASSSIYLASQTLLTAGETIQSKKAFERFAQICGHKIKSFRADNMSFNSREFKADLITKGQNPNPTSMELVHITKMALPNELSKR